MIEIFDDIRKLYQFKSPCPELTHLIEFFSETSLEATAHYIDAEAFTVKLFPSYTPTMWLNLGSAYTIQNGNVYRQVDEKTDILLLRNKIVERINLPTDNIFTIKFHPSAFEAFFGVSQSKIGDDIIDLNDIMPSNILNKLKRESSFEDRVVLLEKYFIEKLAQNKTHAFYSNHINAAIDRFYQSGMSSKNNEIVHGLFISEKSLYRYFTHAIGTNPKHFFSILRARKALTAYNTNKSTFSPYDFGYYDHGHFSKDVVKFTGKPLSFYPK
jgi:AraC-like DNA-binding protein